MKNLGQMMKQRMRTTKRFGPLEKHLHHVTGRLIWVKARQPVFIQHVAHRYVVKKLAPLGLAQTATFQPHLHRM